MNTIAEPNAPSAPASTRPGEPWPATFTVLFGHLSWLRYVWLAVAVVYVLLIGIIDLANGHLDHSLWINVAGWQYWLFAVAGGTTVGVFAPLLAYFGQTRRKLADASMIAGAVIAVLGAALMTLGFLVERWWFERNAWGTEIRPGVDLATIALGEVAVSYLCLFLAAFVAGWLITLCWRVPAVAALAAPLAVVVFACAALLVMPSTVGMRIDVIDSRFADVLPVWVAVLVSLAVTAAGAVAARSGTARVHLDG